MSDVALAHNLVAEIGGDCWNGKSDMIDRVFDAIDGHFRKIKQPHKWTRRRVRALWHKEAAGVRYHEMIELATVAAAAKAKRDQLHQARSEHAEFVARAARMATALAVQDAEYDRELGEAFSRMEGASNGYSLSVPSSGCASNCERGNQTSRAMGSGDCR